jgi:WD40 repeat protein
MSDFAPSSSQQNISNANRDIIQNSKIQGSLLGHQGRCFDLRFHPCEPNVLLSASEDGSVKMWNAHKRTCLQTFLHNKDAEALRAGFIHKYICSAGSDGQVHLWSYLEDDQSPGDQHASATSSATLRCPKGKKVHTLQHRTENSQIYVCEAQVLDNNAASYQEGLNSTQLLTAADSEVYLWDVEHSATASRMWNYTTSTEAETTVFGGIHRNPDREVFVFDAKWCPHSPHEAAIALSDSTIRLLDIRQSQASVLSLSLAIEELEQSGIKLGHATSVNWNHSGTLCSVSFGSGIVALIDIRMVIAN